MIKGCNSHIHPKRFGPRCELFLNMRCNSTRSRRPGNHSQMRDMRQHSVSGARPTTIAVDGTPSDIAVPPNNLLAFATNRNSYTIAGAGFDLIASLPTTTISSTHSTTVQGDGRRWGEKLYMCANSGSLKERVFVAVYPMMFGSRCVAPSDIDRRSLNCWSLSRLRTTSKWRSVAPQFV